MAKKTEIITDELVGGQIRISQGRGFFLELVYFDKYLSYNAQK